MPIGLFIVSDCCLAKKVCNVGAFDCGLQIACQQLCNEFPDFFKD